MTPNFSADELATVKRWLKQQAQDCDARVHVAYRMKATERALALDKDADTAFRWMSELDEKLARLKENA